MINSSDITVVMQGNVRAETLEGVRSIRQVLPDAHLILSTFEQEDVSQLAVLVDELVISKDPGPLPHFTKAFDAGPNNLNRQLVSTQSGLHNVNTQYVLKMRTDCILIADTFVRLYELANSGNRGQERLIVSSYYTRHPRGLSCYLFHISDWFFFGSTGKVRQYCAVPLMSLEDASWFERHPHSRSSTYAACRFRAKFTPEQHIAVNFAKSIGYKVPAFLNERSETLVQEYEHFLMDHFLVAGPEMLGFRLAKYAHLPRSIFQRLDCLEFRDWLRLCSTSELHSLPLRVEGWDMFAQIRIIAHLFRYPIVRGVIVKRSIIKELRRLLCFRILARRTSRRG